MSDRDGAQGVGGRRAEETTSAAQARGISDKLKHSGRSEAGRTEKAREPRGQRTMRTRVNDRMSKE